MSQWDELDEYDRAWALATHIARIEDEARACKACGGDPAECQDPDNQHAYVIELGRCYRTRALVEAQERRKSDNAGVLWKVRLDPALKKSATRKG